MIFTFEKYFQFDLIPNPFYMQLGKLTQFLYHLKRFRNRIIYLMLKTYF